MKLTKDEFIGFIKARIQGVIKKVGLDRDKWLSIIKSGIPLNSDLLIEKNLPVIINLIFSFFDSEQGINDKVDLIKSILSLIKDIPVITEQGTGLNSADFDQLLQDWVNGKPMSNLLHYNQAEDIISDFFTFLLPWIFNGIAKKLRNIELDSFAELLEEISMLIETGLPNLKSIKIYQSGIRSRTVSIELSSYFENELWEKSVQDYKLEILERCQELKELVSDHCSEWIDMLNLIANTKIKVIRGITNFTYNIDTEITNVLIAKMIKGEQHLVSPDLSLANKIDSPDIDFSEINELQGVFFKYQPKEGVWEMMIDNPHIRLNNES